MAYDSQPSTIYMSGETARMAREIEEVTGVKASRLFREFVQRYRRAIRPGVGINVEALAFILPALSPWDVNAPRPFLGGEHLDRVAGFDIWEGALDPAYPKAFKVFLMGKSLEHPVSNHQNMWTQFVESGGNLEILLQGDISGGKGAGPQLFATDNPALNSTRSAARQRTIIFLKELAAHAHGNVEVRNTGQLLLHMNAGLIFREDKTVDIHLEFGFGEALSVKSSTATMTATHSPPDEIYSLIVGAMEELWLRSVSEPGFEQLQ
ncbi:MAG: hypothetical protein J4N80_08710 [Chloroflexi bacterium]|nr:hypothetical protein [Chloroflexota bacterium]